MYVYSTLLIYCFSVVTALCLLIVGPGGLQASAPQPPGADETHRIVVHAANPGPRLSPLIYGTNILWPGHANGIPDGYLSETGYREAVRKWYGYLPLVNELGPTILRFPGGLASNTYIWTRGIGPPMARERMHGGSTPVPIIGTDEFLLFCEELGADSMITVNVNRATGTRPLAQLLATESLYRENAALAADWVEYCNAPDDGSNPRGGVDWAAVRARNGHRDPYGVKYWELGNEIQQLPLRWYLIAIRSFSEAMKSVDPSIRIGVVDALRQWKAERARSWFHEIGIGEGKRFDFWSHHTYMPGTSGKIQGFVLFGPGASVSVPFDPPEPDTYTLRFEAGTGSGRALLRLSVPRTGVQKDCGIGRAGRECALQVRLEGRPCYVKLELAEGAQVFVRTVAGWRGERSGEGYLNLENSPQLTCLVEAGGLVAGKRFWSPEELEGKPRYVTEYNSSCTEFVRPPHLCNAYHLRDALNVGTFLQSFIRDGVPVAAQWLLYGDMAGYGLIEGVALDPNHGGEMGRANPHPRPSFYMIKLYRDHLEGDLIPLEVKAPAYHIGPPRPFVALGGVDRTDLDVSYLQAVAARDSTGNTLRLLVQNLHPEKPLTAHVELEGFDPGPTMEAFVLESENSWSTNEPEACPKGECVTIHSRRSPVSGNDFSHTFPPHSATALVFYRKGVRLQGPDPPQDLSAEVSEAKVLLSWKPPNGPAPEGYHLYRSRFDFGPFRNRISSLPANRLSAVDDPADCGIRYTYAVRSFDELGRESPFSNRVTLMFKDCVPRIRREAALWQ